MRNSLWAFLRLVSASLLIAFAFPWISGVPTGQATATITVTTTVDDITNNGNCTLREAIQAANLDQAVDKCPAGSGADTIQLPQGTYPVTLPGDGEDLNQTGDLDIRTSLTLQGDGVDKTIIKVGSTGFKDRLFQIIPSNVQVKLDGLTLRDVNFPVESNGKPPQGGAIYNTANLTVTNASFINNSANDAEGEGGAIYNLGTLSVSDTYFNKNFAGYGAASIQNNGSLTAQRDTFDDNNGYASGGIWNMKNGQATVDQCQFLNNHIQLEGGGAIYQDGDMQVSNSLFDNNWGDSGSIFNSGSLRIENTTIKHGQGRFGVLENQGGSLTLVQVTFASNVGAISVERPGTIRIENSVLQDNQGRGAGALEIGAGAVATILNTSISGNQGAAGGGISNKGDLRLEASTISNNTASNANTDYTSAGLGGGIYNAGTLYLLNSTLTGNQAVSGAGIYQDEGAGSSTINFTTINANQNSGVVIQGGKINFLATILWGNSTDCSSPLDSPVTSAGSNLLGAVSGCHWPAHPYRPDIISTPQHPYDPQLGPLADNGGPTFTEALLPGSDAIHISGLATCPPADQRGVPRPSVACDIGAYEQAAAQETMPYHLYLPLILR